MYLLWWLSLSLSVTRGFLINVTVLDQTNQLERWPDLTQHLRIQNITDIAGQPLLVVADDVVLPDTNFFQAQGVAQGLVDCQSMTVLFSGVRLKSFSNPSSVTMQLMWHDEALRTASARQVFYQKSWAWPSNDFMWQRDYHALPWPFELTLRSGELGDDGVTRFHFRDSRFLAPLRRFWVALYATMPQQQTAGQRLNALYWITQSAQHNATPLGEPLYGGASNLPFQARVVDPLGILRAPAQLKNWSNASDMLAWTGPVAPTGQMAWRLFFQCHVPALPTAEPTAVPTGAPTLAPTREPATTPSAQQLPTSAPLDARNESAVPLGESTNNGGSGVGGAPVNWGLVIGLTLACAASVTTLCFAVRFLRRKRALQRAADNKQKRAQSTGRDDAPIMVRQFSEYALIPLDGGGAGGGGIRTTDASSTISAVGNSFLKEHYESGINTASDTEL